MEFIQLTRQNTWWTNKDNIRQDPKITAYEQATIKWRPRIKQYMDLEQDVIYSIRGPRQVGKTTFIKTIIKELLEKKDPKTILYYSCDLIKDGKELNELLETYLAWAQPQTNERIHLFLDEISSVKEWQKGIKLFIDTHANKNKTIILTGSHALDIKNSTERLPGRTGEQTGIQLHKIFLPMKFSEYVTLRKPSLDISATREDFKTILEGRVPQSAKNMQHLHSELDELLNEYLLTGGFMPALNYFVDHHTIPLQLYELYTRQISADMSAVNRDERTAKALIAELLKKTSSVISWNNMAKGVGTTVPTVSQYMNILQQMFVINIYYKREHDGTIKRRSDKKIHFLNPFIFHAANALLAQPGKEPITLAQESINNPETKALLIEAVIGDHLNRAAHNEHPTDYFDPTDFVFYVRTKKYEIDYWIKTQHINAGVEVKYREHIRDLDLKGITKTGGCVVSKKTLEQRRNLSIIPASTFLLYI